MKNLIIAIFCLFTLSTFAQEKADSVKYCEVVTCSKAVTTSVNSVFEVNYAFDFGAGETYTPDKPMKDKGGKPIEFNSPVDMMQLMSRKGYDLISTCAFPNKAFGGERWIIHYTFKHTPIDNNKAH